MIFKSRNILQLWDLKTKKLVKELKPNIAFWLATYSDYGLVLLGAYGKLQLLDDKTFEELKQTIIPRNKESEKLYNNYYPVNMIVGKNILHINYFVESYYIDLETLSIIEFSKTNAEDEGWLTKENEKNIKYIKSVRRDKRNNITRKMKMNPNRKKYFQKYEDKFNPIIWEAFMKYIWHTNFYSTLSSCQLDPSSYIASYTINNAMTLYTLEFTKASLNNVVETSRYKIWQSRDSWYVEDENHFFNASEDIRRYLYYINDSGIREGIDDEMFNRYKKNYKKTLKIKNPGTGY